MSISVYETSMTNYENSSRPLPLQLLFVTDAINYPFQFEAQLPEVDHINQLLKALSLLKEIETAIPDAKKMLESTLKNMNYLLND